MTKKSDKFFVADNSDKPKRRAPSTAFKPGNPWRFKPGESGNPGGRPALLSDAYREWLAFKDENGVTNASKVAMATGAQAAKGDIQSAKELRQATEGDRLVFDVRDLTEEQLERIARGENPANVIANSSGGGAGTEATQATVRGASLKPDIT